MSVAVRELQRRLLEVAPPGERVATLLELACRHADARENREGLRAAREALEIARFHDDRAGVAAALLVASRCELQRGNLLGTVSTGLEALEAHAAGDGSGRSEALEAVAKGLLGAGSLELAQSFAESAVAEAAGACDPFREAATRLVYARALGERGQRKPARRQFRSALRHFRDLGDAARHREALLALAANYRQEGVEELCRVRLAAAHRCWRHAAKLYGLALGAPDKGEDEAAIRAGRAECLCRLGHGTHAYAELARALDAALRGGPAEVVATCYLWECHTLRALGDLSGAERACRYACIAAEQVEHDEKLAACLEALAALHEARGRFADAAEAMRRSRTLAREREATLAMLRDDLRALLYRSGHTRKARLRTAA